MDTTPITADSILKDIAGSSTPAPTPVQPATQDATPVSQVQKPDATADNAATPVTQAAKPAEPQSQATSVTEPITDWDSAPASTVTADIPASFDFSSIGKAIEMDIKSQEQIIQEFKKLKDENVSLKQSSTTTQEVFANDVIKQANEIAKNNGDYLGFLGVAAINYDAIDPRTLLESEVRGYFPEGEEGDAKMNSYLDSLDESEIQVRGSQIRQSYKNQQAQSKQSLVQATEAKKTAEVERKKAMDTQLSQTLEKVKDVDGFVLNPSHKKQVYNDISSGEVFKKHFYTDGKYDFDKAIKAAFILNEYQKVTTYLRDKAKLDGKRDVINSITNAELNRTTSSVTSDNTKTPMDSYFERLMKKGQ